MARKRVINTHIATEEHAFLKRRAKREAISITMVLRQLIRSAMVKERRQKHP